MAQRLCRASLSLSRDMFPPFPCTFAAPAACTRHLSLHLLFAFVSPRRLLSARLFYLLHDLECDFPACVYKLQNFICRPRMPSYHVSFHSQPTCTAITKLSIFNANDGYTSSPGITPLTCTDRSAIHHVQLCCSYGPATCSNPKDML